MNNINIVNIYNKPPVSKPGGSSSLLAWFLRGIGRLFSCVGDCFSA